MWNWNSLDAELKEFMMRNLKCLDEALTEFKCGTEKVQMRNWKSSDAEMKEFRRRTERV